MTDPAHIHRTITRRGNLGMFLPEGCPVRPVEVEHMQQAVTAMLADTAAEEALADAAFLALWKLRDKLARRDFNTAACRADEAIETLQAACREFVK
ncbi:MAG: hypothetical protein J7496_08725 [Novosphingobium sp.]|nr:hypothetical protein [Novosphingobium sp.]